MALGPSENSSPMGGHCLVHSTGSFVSPSSGEVRSGAALRLWPGALFGFVARGAGAFERKGPGTTSVTWWGCFFWVVLFDFGGVFGG